MVGNAATTITRTADADGESALGDLIADAQREYADAQIAFMNPGGIRADIQAGEVTYGELFTVQPFDNQVVRMKLTGDQIYRLLEQQFRADGSSRILQISGIKFTYNASNPVGQRITSVTLTDGTPIDRNDTDHLHRGGQQLYRHRRRRVHGLQGGKPDPGDAGQRSGRAGGICRQPAVLRDPPGLRAKDHQAKLGFGYGRVFRGAPVPLPAAGVDLHIYQIFTPINLLGSSPSLHLPSNQGRLLHAGRARLR